MQIKILLQNFSWGISISWDRLLMAQAIRNLENIKDTCQMSLLYKKNAVREIMHQPYIYSFLKFSCLYRKHWVTVRLISNNFPNSFVRWGRFNQYDFWISEFNFIKLIYFLSIYMFILILCSLVFNRSK